MERFLASICESDSHETIKHAIHDAERHWADCTFSLGIAFTQATLNIVPTGRVKSNPLFKGQCSLDTKMIILANTLFYAGTVPIHFKIYLKLRGFFGETTLKKPSKQTQKSREL